MCHISTKFAENLPAYVIRVFQYFATQPGDFANFKILFMLC